MLIYNKKKYMYYDAEVPFLGICPIKAMVQ